MTTTVNAPSDDELAALREGATLISLLSPALRETPSRAELDASATPAASPATGG